MPWPAIGAAQTTTRFATKGTGCFGRHCDEPFQLTATLGEACGAWDQGAESLREDPLCQLAGPRVDDLGGAEEMKRKRRRLSEEMVGLVCVEKFKIETTRILSG